MSVININPFGGVEASIQDIRRHAHKRSYWARIVRKNGYIEFKYLNKETKDHEKLEDAIKKGDVQHVMLFEGAEIEDIKKVVEMVVEEVKAALVMAHIEKEQLHNLLKEDKELGMKGFPRGDLKKLETEVFGTLNKINAELRTAGNMLIGESSKG